MIRSYDAVVVGAGIFGAWIAHELKRSSARVLLIDQHGPGNSRSSSGGETRIIRMFYGADEIYTQSSMRSLELWKQYFPETFCKTGVLITASPDEPYLIASHEVLNRNGVPNKWLNFAALQKHFPQISFDRDTAGVWEPESGVLMARRAVQAVAQTSNFKIAQAIRMKNRHTLETSVGNLRAETFVFACGPWLPKLFPKIVGPRIRPTRQEVFFFGTPPGEKCFSAPSMPAWIAFFEGAYSVPAIDGRGFKLAMDAHGTPIDPESGSREITPQLLSSVRAMLKKRFPALARAPLLEARVCQYENTSSGDFLIDRHPDFDNVWLAGGGSGHGFKHGPFVGEYVAAQIAGTRAPEPRFSLASKKTRFQRKVH